MTIDFLDGLLDLSPVSEMSARSPGTNQYSPISALAIQMLVWRILMWHACFYVLQEMRVLRGVYSLERLKKVLLYI